MPAEKFPCRRVGRDQAPGDAEYGQRRDHVMARQDLRGKRPEARSILEEIRTDRLERNLACLLVGRRTFRLFLRYKRADSKEKKR